MMMTQQASTAVEMTEIEIPGYVYLSYPSEVTLKKSGCQTIKFNYVVDENLPLENTVWLVQIIHQTKKELFGEIAWFSVMTYKGEDAIPSLPRAGIKDAKICRKPWTTSSADTTRKYSGAKPATYRMYFAGVTLDPLTGALLGEKTEFFRSIKFK
jgi:hypothetical protein